MAVHRLILQSVGCDGIVELVRVIPPVPVHREDIQKPGCPQDIRPPEGPQEMIEEVQIELGVVGRQQRPLSPAQQVAERLTGVGLLHALLFQLLFRDASELGDKGRQRPPRGEAEQQVHAVRLSLRGKGGGPQLDDLVPPELDAGGLRVEYHDPVKLLPKACLHGSPSCRMLSFQNRAASRNCQGGAAVDFLPRAG